MLMLEEVGLSAFRPHVAEPLRPAPNPEAAELKAPSDPKVPSAHISPHLAPQKML